MNQEEIEQEGDDKCGSDRVDEILQKAPEGRPRGGPAILTRHTVSWIGRMPSIWQICSISILYRFFAVLTEQLL